MPAICVVMAFVTAGLASLEARAAPVPVTFALDEPPASAAPAIREALVFAATGALRTPIQRMTLQPSDPVVLAIEPGRDVVVQLVLESGAYLLEGPFRWPFEPGVRRVAFVTRRTVGASLPDASSRDPPIWIDADGRASSDEWPRCSVRASTWTCVGVKQQASGLAVFDAGSPALFAHVPAKGPPAGVRALWATVVTLVPGGDPPPGHARLLLWRAVDLTADLAADLATDPAATAARRVVSDPAAGCRVVALGAAAFAIGCNGEQDVEVEIEAAGKAKGRTTVRAAGASLLAPVAVPLADEVVVTGRVETGDGRAAAGAQVDISELLQVRGAGGATRVLRRSVASAESDPDGRFDIRGLGSGRYEALAVHPRLGRGRARFEPGPHAVVVRLTPGVSVRGRVVHDGLPLAGARVGIPPEIDAYLRAADPYDLVSAESVSGRDGRFEVLVPPGGAAEVRIVFDGVTVRRSIPVSAARNVDLGDVELSSAIRVTIAYLGDESCVLLAAGPFGRSGVFTIEASAVGPNLRRLLLPEAGRWVLAAKCGAREVPLDPALLEVPAGATEWSAEVSLRR